MKAERACDHGQKTARGQRAWPRAPDCHGTDDGGICGRGDEDRYGGGGGCVYPGFFQHMIADSVA